MKKTAYIGLGSNLENPLQQLAKAVDLLQANAAVHIKARSSIYQSAPVGPKDQPDFLNQVVAIETYLLPLELLNVLQAIENEMGRVRLRHWGPRVIDCDLLLFDDEVIGLPALKVPHPEMKSRAFVMVPLAEIAPSLQLPCGAWVNEWKKNEENSSISRYV